MIIQASKLLAEVDYRYGPARAIWPDGRQLEIKNTDGDLNLIGSQINYLPRGLTVGGNLNLAYAQINYLPRGLQVGGYLYLEGTQITSLPEGLKVGGWLYLSKATITKSQVPEHLKIKCNW